MGAGGQSVTHYWLFKSEPNAWSWPQQVAKGEAGEPWSGVRNALAQQQMKAMQVGDLGFFYHSNIGKEIVGVVEVCQAFQPDPTDSTQKWGLVYVKAVKPCPKPVTLAQVKATPALSNMKLVTMSRLSVQPVREDEWALICQMAGFHG